jgi:hypothetical protein
MRRHSSSGNLLSLRTHPETAGGETTTVPASPTPVMAVGTVAGLTESPPLPSAVESSAVGATGATAARPGVRTPPVPGTAAGTASQKKTQTNGTSVTDESEAARRQGWLGGVRTELEKGWVWAYGELWRGMLRQVNPVLFPDRILQAQQLGMLQLVTMALRSNTALLCWLLMVVNVMVNANLLAMVFPLAMFLVALLDSPTCDFKVWRAFLAYLAFVVLLKVTFELPVFCMNTHDYAQYSTADKADASLLDTSRWWASIQPHCPPSLPYDPQLHAEFAKSAAVLFLVKKPRSWSLMRWLLADILLFAALLFHSYHVHMLGCWVDDAYERVHPERQPKAVTRFGASRVGESLNRGELVVRRFYHRMFCSDEILVDPVVLRSQMQGETRTTNNDGPGVRSSTLTYSRYMPCLTYRPHTIGSLERDAHAAHVLSEGSSLSPGKGLHHQRSSRHAMVPLSDTSPHPEG